MSAIPADSFSNTLKNTNTLLLENTCVTPTIRRTKIFGNRTYNNLTFSFYEFENDERIIETSFKIIITNFYSELFVQNLRYYNLIIRVESNLDYPDSLEPLEIVRIIEGRIVENKNINEEQNRAKLIKLRKRHLIVKQQFYKSFGIEYHLHLHFYYVGCVGRPRYNFGSVSSSL